MARKPTPTTRIASDTSTKLNPAPLATLDGRASNAVPERFVFRAELPMIYCVLPSETCVTPVTSHTVMLAV